MRCPQAGGREGEVARPVSAGRLFDVTPLIKQEGDSFDIEHETKPC